LLLRGKKSKGEICILELVVPPLAVHGHGFANIPLHMLPMDFSIVGTVHSHPSGNLSPSDVDFNHFFGRILMIMGFPFADEQNIAVYNSNGEKLQLQILALMHKVKLICLFIRIFTIFTSIKLLTLQIQLVFEMYQ